MEEVSATFCVHRWDTLCGGRAVWGWEPAPREGGSCRAERWGQEPNDGRVWGDKARGTEHGVMEDNRKRNRDGALLYLQAEVGDLKVIFFSRNHRVQRMRRQPAVRGKKLRGRCWGMEGQQKRRIKRTFTPHPSPQTCQSMSNQKQPSFFLCSYDRKKTIFSWGRTRFLSLFSWGSLKWQLAS